MIVGSICSGIGCEAVAWAPIKGWRHAFLAEIEPFPRAVLKARFPDVPLHGDFTTIEADTYEPIDVLVGGTPCQSFSVAGLRGGLSDDRGNLALQFCLLARRLRPRWVVWENVPGVLSSEGGRDFGAVLGGLAELGYGLAYRVLDAQYCRVDGFPRAVPQRRRRLFVVGHLGDWQRAAAVLFERASLSGDSPPGRTAGQGTARPIASCPDGGSGYRNDADTADNLIAPPLTGSGRGVARAGESRGQDPLVPTIANPLTARMHKGVNTTADEGQTMIVADPISANEGRTYSHEGKNNFRLHNVVPVAFDQRGREGGSQMEGPHATANIRAAEGGSSKSYVAFDTTQITSPDNRSQPQPGDPCHPLAADAHPPAVASPMMVRRLTPRECERLQGLPDDWTLIPWRGGMAPDGPRYRAIGNGMAVNVMRWIGRRIAAVEALDEEG